MTKEEKKVYNKVYHLANAEKIKARYKAWQQANPEKVRAHKKAYSLANPEKNKAYCKAYSEGNLEKMKEMRLACHIVSRDNLSRGYIATLLKMPVAVQAEIPKLEELKRTHVKLKRLIYEKPRKSAS